MKLETTVFEYTENATGRHTEMQYRDDEGNTLAARLPGWIDPAIAIANITSWRQRDRNREGAVS